MAAKKATTTDVKLAELMGLFRSHAEEDTRRFASVETKLDSMDKKIDSLLQSRSYGRGMAKMAGIIGGVLGAVVTAVIAYLKGH